MAFLFCYHKTQEESQKTLGHWDQLQEADYNIARSFHQIGTLLELSSLISIIPDFIARPVSFSNTLLRESTSNL